jgi:hypothetical protein
MDTDAHEPDRLPEETLETIADWLADQFADVLEYDLRIDAGEQGRIWIAIRDARGDDEEHASRTVFEQTRDLLDDVPSEIADDFESRISSGRADEEIVFVCELYRFG